ncbi:hypothetical protein LEN26_018875 [Aphanomyces euteiches]|nr:hypothetical protein LEN26_018875 [Aphanomyces euteiches]KAH9124825.1 hypothetical protein AeMF1_004471 [Aphanomyces euteiches]KAH9187185.1 hypothetical protein AeNC1_010841 [Aphanomyces euteiches]
MERKGQLSFILNEPPPLSAYALPRLDEYTRLPPLAKKRPLDALSPSETVKSTTASIAYSPVKKQLTKRSEKCPVPLGDGLFAKRGVAPKTPLDKRRYNRERQQNLRKQENLERQTLRHQAQELEREWERLSHQKRLRMSNSPLMPQSAASMHHLLNARVAGYTAFAQSIQEWVAKILQDVDADMEWLQSLEKMSDGSSSACTNAQPLVYSALDVDLSGLPPSSRKRMYNRLRQRLYRQRELREVELLHEQVRELSEQVELWKTNPRAAAAQMGEASEKLRTALRHNDQLKARVQQYVQFAAQVHEWVRTTSSQLEDDFPLVASLSS